VPWWAMLSASCAPVVLIGGWTLGAARQPAGFNPVTDTISALAAYGATDRWLMTSALAGLGICHTVTALGLRPGALPGRLVLAAGGIGTFFVAVFPQPASGSSPAHVRAAALGFVALAVWPALAWRRVGRPRLTPTAGVAAAAVLVALVAWFGAELSRDGSLIGLSERAAAGAQALFPLGLVITWLARSGRQRTGAPRTDKAVDAGIAAASG